MNLKNTSESLIKYKRIKYEPITVKEPHKYDIKEFADPDEFTQYYRQNESEFYTLTGDTRHLLSTLVLNRTYKVPGYRITVTNRGKDDEELMLRKDYYGSGSTEGAATSAALDELKARIENIEQYLEQLKI